MLSHEKLILIKFNCFRCVILNELLTRISTRILSGLFTTIQRILITNLHMCTPSHAMTGCLQDPYRCYSLQEDDIHAHAAKRRIRARAVCIST